MFGQERSKAWSQLPEPKPSWETFKRMLPVFDHDPEKTRQAWIKHVQKERRIARQTFAWPAR